MRRQIKFRKIICVINIFFTAELMWKCMAVRGMMQIKKKEVNESASFPPLFLLYILYSFYIGLNRWRGIPSTTIGETSPCMSGRT